MNLLYKADCLAVLKTLHSESIDLIYLDPPFGTGKEWKADKGGFSDKWNPHNMPSEEYQQLLDYDKRLHDRIEIMTEIYSFNMQAYIVFMANRLIALHRVLKPTGSIYLHCDPTASHYLKIVMDSLFGKENFRAEIIWQRNSGAAKGSQHVSRTFGRDTDTLFHYSKTKDYTHNPPTQSLTADQLAGKFPHIDINGRRYNVNVPLMSAPSMGDRPNLCYEYKGVSPPHTSGWRVSKERLIKMDNAGDIIWRIGQRPLRKSYADQYKGKPIGSLWTDIPRLAGKERIGYPTQKSLKLLDRIIETSSNKGSVVMDPFCGSSTTLASAHKLGRSWIGVDVTEAAISLTQDRLAGYDLYEPDGYMLI